METGKNLYLRKFAFEKLGEVEFFNATVEDDEIELKGAIAFDQICYHATYFPVTSARLVENNNKWTLYVEFDTTGWPVDVEEWKTFELTDEETALALNISLYGASDPEVQKQLTVWANKRLFNDYSLT